MSVNLKKFVTNSLPEFLLLTLEPNTVFAIDSIKNFHSVIVCYNVHNFYKNFKIISRRPVDLVSLDEFILYCESKIQSQFITKQIDYQCCMNVSDLIRMEPWVCLYNSIGPGVMKFLLFNCLLFVPIQDGVYYCVHTPSPHSDRYEVLQSFWNKASTRWNTKKYENNQRNDRLKTKSTCFNIANLLKNVNKICHNDVDSMLREILQIGDEIFKQNYDVARFDVLKRKLKVLAAKDTLQNYKNIYQNVIGYSFPAQVPLGRIKKFANAVVHKVVPRELFGIINNRDQYCKNLCQILNCGKFHSFTVQHIMHKIKVNKINWLNCVGAEQRTDIITKTLVWLTNVFVFGRITHIFQIVTTNPPNNGVAYFSKVQWAKICHDKLSPLISGGEFFKEFKPDTSSKQSDPKSKNRNWKICPYAKPSGIRLIFKLQRKENGIEKRLMDNCLTFLRCLSRTYSTEFRSVSRPQFFRGWKTLQESRQGNQSPVYYVRTDFRDAFTSFYQDKLQTVVRDRIKDHFGKKSRELCVYTVDMVKIGSGGTVYCKKRKFFDGLPTPRFSGGSLVFYDKKSTVSLAQIWDIVRKCIRCNVVERGGHWWTMTRGIVQGDRLSVALCDLLLADLQATHLKDSAGDASGCLYRFVDDYVFVSYDLTAARHFLTIMCKGFDDYGLLLNRSKTETNLDGGGDGMVKFLGFRLNVITGEVIKDEDVFHNRRPLHFFDYDLGRGQSGRTLYTKITGPNQHTVPIVLVSKSFNSVTTVARNLASVVAYKAFAFVATVKQYFFHINPVYLLKTVHSIARLMYAKVYGLIRHSAVTPMQCKWIVYEVYARMFCKYFHADGDCHIAWVVDRIRDSQSIVGQKCITCDLKTALKHYDFTKMFG